MNHDSFKHIEVLFHELKELNEHDLPVRLSALAQTDPEKARTLERMFKALSRMPTFLDPSWIDTALPQGIEIALDGTTVLGGRFTLIERIGVGGSSTVFRARAADPDRDVAVKMLRFGLNEAQIHERFVLESQTLALLTHPHIAHVYQTGLYKCDGIKIPWIAMELIPGSMTIIDYAKHAKLSGDQRIELFLKVCDAIQTAHDAAVLHLDLNASNILIDPHGFPKIIDFGLLGILKSSTNTQPTFVGTQLSMAPEQTVFRSGAFDQRTDIYALGILLTELLSGTQLQAFAGISTQEACRLIAIGKAREQLTELQSIPLPIRSVIESMIRVDPDNRIYTVSAVSKLFRDLQPHPHQNRTPAIAGSIAMLCVAVLLLLMLPRPIPSQPDSSPRDPSGLSDTGSLRIPQQVAIDISSQNPRTSKYSQSHTRIIERLSEAVESDQALTFLERADMHAKLADQNRVAGRYESAIAHYQRSAGLFKEVGQVVDYNWVLLGLVQTQLFLERIDDAQETLAQLDRTVEVPTLFLVDLSMAEAGVQLALEQHENATRQAHYTMKLIDSLPAQLNQERIERLLDLNSIFSTLSLQDDARNALYNARKFTKEIYPSTGSEVALVDIRIAMNLAQDAGDDRYQESVRLIRDSISRLENANDQFHVAWSLRQLGNVYMRHGDVVLAIESYTNSLTKMTTILGEQHHESIICSAQLIIVQYVNGDTSPELSEKFTSTIDKLAAVIGENHSMIQSLHSDWNRVHN